MARNLAQQICCQRSVARNLADKILSQSFVGTNLAQQIRSQEKILARMRTKFVARASWQGIWRARLAEKVRLKGFCAQNSSKRKNIGKNVRRIGYQSFLGGNFAGKIT